MKIDGKEKEAKGRSVIPLSSFDPNATKKDDSEDKKKKKALADLGLEDGFVLSKNKKVDYSYAKGYTKDLQEMTSKAPEEV